MVLFSIRAQIHELFHHRILRRVKVWNRQHLAPIYTKSFKRLRKDQLVRMTRFTKGSLRWFSRRLRGTGF